MEEGTDLRDICKVECMELSNCLEVELKCQKTSKVELKILNLGNWENASAMNRTETVKWKGWFGVGSMVQL